MKKGPINGKCTVLTPPTESRRRLEMTEKFCYYPPPTESRRFPEIREHFCYYPPPPLNRDGFRRSQKISATTPPPTESRRLPEITENFCYYPPPPLNLGDLALHTKGAPSLGKSWICDCCRPTLRRTSLSPSFHLHTLPLTSTHETVPLSQFLPIQLDAQIFPMVAYA